MKIATSHIFLAIVFLGVMGVANSVELTQADKIASRFDNTSGKVIELKASFSNPLKSGDEVMFSVAGVPTIKVRPTDGLDLQALLIRFRLKVGDQISALHTRNGTKVSEASITPRVALDFENAPAPSAPPSMLSTSKESIMAGYGLSAGSCIVLFNNYQVSSSTAESRIEILTAKGKVDIDLGSRVAANPSFGLTPVEGSVLEKCEGRLK